MKKTILATVIAATSFASLAAVHVDPIPGNDGDLTPIHEGGVIVLPIESGKPDLIVTPVDPNFEGKLPGAIVPPHVAPIDPGFGIPGQPSDGDLEPIGDIKVPDYRTVDQKVELFNKTMEKKGKSANITKQANDGYVLTFSDGQGNLHERTLDASDVAEITARKADIAEKVKAGLPGTDPIDVIIEPIEGEKPAPSEGQKLVEGLKKVADGIRDNNPELGEHGQGQVISYSQSAQAQTQSQIDELYAIGNQNASDIDTLFAEVDRLDTRIDQTQALNAATVNARPMVTNGMTAFGAGVGYAGSEAALAIGVAHSFEDTGWSASGTVAASSDDSVLGAGVQYAF